MPGFKNSRIKPLNFNPRAKISVKQKSIFSFFYLIDVLSCRDKGIALDK